jgi:hypothetical protein
MDTLRLCVEWVKDFYVRHAALFNLGVFLATVVPVLLTWWNTRSIRRRDQLRSRLINLVLESPTKQRRVLPCAVLRSQFSRAELVGIFGMYAGKDRFDANQDIQLLPLLERGTFNDVLEGRRDELTIPCSESFFNKVSEQIAQRAGA